MNLCSEHFTENLRKIQKYGIKLKIARDTMKPVPLQISEKFVVFFSVYTSFPGKICVKPWRNWPTYAISKINMLCNLCCLKTRLRLLSNKYQQHSSLNLVSQQFKLCNIFIFGMAYCLPNIVVYFYVITWRSGYCDSNKEECDLNQSKDDSFVKRVAKNNN